MPDNIPNSQLAQSLDIVSRDCFSHLSANAQKMIADASFLTATSVKIDVILCEILGYSAFLPSIFATAIASRVGHALSAKNAIR